MCIPHSVWCLHSRCYTSKRSLLYIALIGANFCSRSAPRFSSTCLPLCLSPCTRILNERSFVPRTGTSSDLENPTGNSRLPPNCMELQGVQRMALITGQNYHSYAHKIGKH